MTETDATTRPSKMPEKFIPYLDKYRIYRLFKEMLEDLVIHRPKDHLKHMKVYLVSRLHSTNDTNRIILLVSPELKNIDVKKIAKELMKSDGMFVITRRSIMDKYMLDDNYKPGCVSPILMSEVTKKITIKEPVIASGWLMFDHPCTIREARCLQQDGVLPTVTLVLTPPPPVAPRVVNSATAARGFNDQDFEGLKYVYRATLKEIHIEEDDDIDKISHKCFNAIRAYHSGAQGPGQSKSVVGAPSVYRVLLIGPRGSGRRTQAKMLAQHFGLVYIDFYMLYNEAKNRKDEIGEKLRAYGGSLQLNAQIVLRRLMSKDCIDLGWVMNGYPNTGPEFEQLDSMKTPPNRIIILNADFATCKERVMNACVDWCTGKRVPPGSGPRVVLKYLGQTEADIQNELEQYFAETIADLRAAAGITAVELNIRQDSIEEIQVKIQAAVMAAPGYDLISSAPIRNAGGEERVNFHLL